jgi:phosphopantetheinyl transferase (holo-ACP synthase)
MIGNDVVDLALARQESNWKRKGFLEKIFTEKEQLLIKNAMNSEVMVWNLWSRKEAAYKIYNRKTLIRGYFPLQIECFDLETIARTTYGKVYINKQVYYTKTTISSQLINTIAVENATDFAAVKTLKNRKNIQRIERIPSLFNDRTSTLQPLSISHHGRFERIITI